MLGRRLGRLPRLQSLSPRRGPSTSSAAAGDKPTTAEDEDPEAIDASWSAGAPAADTKQCEEGTTVSASCGPINHRAIGAVGLIHWATGVVAVLSSLDFDPEGGGDCPEALAVKSASCRRSSAQ